MQRMTPRRKRFIRIAYGTTLLLLLVFVSALVLILKTKELAFDSIFRSEPEIGAGLEHTPEPFPVGVDPARKIVTEQPHVNTYLESHLSRNEARPDRRSVLGRLTAKLAHFEWYQNLASPLSRVLVIFPGERREEVVDNFGDILGWNTTERNDFSARIEETAPKLTDGKFFPGNYMVHKDATPDEVSQLLLTRFENEVLVRYNDSVAAIVPLKDTLTIASLLEREAYDFNDMRQIAGVIWNRLFIDMNLQIDATLQYAKGTVSHYAWWPPVRPEDKFIDSSFNTYRNTGLPPAPIASPSLEAVVAALNPADTDCMYYFHDANGDFYCSQTYEEHVTLLRKIYGRGK